MRWLSVYPEIWTKIGNFGGHFEIQYGDTSVVRKKYQQVER